jgi:hypothetical protein
LQVRAGAKASALLLLRMKIPQRTGQSLEVASVNEHSQELMAMPNT